MLPSQAAHASGFLSRNIRLLERPADASVLSNTPEVDCQQEGHHQWNRDTVQNVKPIERYFAHGSFAKQHKPGIRGARDHVDTADAEERLSRAFMSQEWCRARHVRTDGNGPDRQLVPRV